jgi:hypothetical protein
MFLPGSSKSSTLLDVFLPIKKKCKKNIGIGSRLLEVLYVRSKKKTQVPICLIGVPICLGTEMSRTGADLSQCRSV